MNALNKAFSGGVRGTHHGELQRISRQISTLKTVGTCDEGARAPLSPSHAAGEASTQGTPPQAGHAALACYSPGSHAAGQGRWSFHTRAGVLVLYLCRCPDFSGLISAARCQARLVGLAEAVHSQRIKNIDQP